MGLSNQTEERLVQKAKALRYPITVNLELLPVCNLDCKMCFIRSSWKDVKDAGGLKTVDEWLFIAKELLEAGTLFILLTGGEIFLYPDFKRLYIELYKMGFIITLNTNGTMIDESVMEWLVDYPPKIVSLSLYGSNDEVYERLCGSKGMFTKFNHAVELLQANHIAIECKTVLTPLNFDDLENCVKYVNSKNIIYETATYSFKATRKLGCKEQVRFTPKEMVNALIKTDQYFFTPEQIHQNMLDFLQKYENTPHVEGNCINGFNCSAANSSCWINWQGKMIPCAMMNEPYTEPFKDGFNNSWEQLKNKVDQIILCNECSNCDKRLICTVCPASLYAESGSFQKSSKYHCEYTDRLLEIYYQNVKVHGVKKEG